MSNETDSFKLKSYTIRTRLEETTLVKKLYTPTVEDGTRRTGIKRK